MKPRRLILLSLLITLVVATWTTWPLATVFHEGMPSSSRPEAGGPRCMISGDHLQFLFQLWMFADAMAGGTPLFHHVYEFNQGDDKARYEFGSYYFPFGVLYAAGHALGGRAVGWNLMLLISVWLSYLMTWVLARRFCASAWTAAVAALPGLLLPYLWVCCLGGSPTGPGMLWVPVVFFGIDKAVRDRRVWGGILAGAALFMAPWADLHVFFFAFLVAPAWVVFCFAAEAWLPAPGPGPLAATPPVAVGAAGKAWRRALPLLPLILLMGAAYLQTAAVKQSFSGTVQEAGRKGAEAAIYAPTWEGWVAWDPGSRHGQIYLGLVVLAVLAAGIGLLAWDLRRRRPGAWGRAAVAALLLAAIAAIALLALGPNVPRDPHQHVWKTLRSVLPPYKMIRQPAKIFCILAPFLAVGLALALDRIGAVFARRRLAGAALLCVGVLIVWDYGRRIEPTICLLDPAQGAYRAIAEDAARRGRDNRALSIPIWPGDSHWNSLTEYYATLHRTKMLNGYRPTVRKQYLEEVFERLAPMNMGYISDDRLEALLARKIGYLVLQEDAFPEKVSPFAVVHTLAELLRHPRLQYLQRDHEIWAFRILDKGEARSAGGAEGPPPAALLGGRAWRARTYAEAALVRRESADDEGYARLERPADAVPLPPRQFYALDGLRYLVAARGTGTLTGTFDLGPSNGFRTVSVAVSPGWAWVELPVPAFTGVQDVGLTLTATGGVVDVDRVTFVAGAWPWLEPGQRLVLPANAFFRAGYSEFGDGSVHLSRARVPAAAVFYAPYVAVRPGRYRIEVGFDSPAAAGATLGGVSVTPAGGSLLAAASVVAGQSACLEFRYDGHRPLRFELSFTRQADLAVRSVTLARVE